MQSKDPARRPAYSLQSVDNVLRLLQMLRDSGGVRLKDVAEELHVAPSTAHRLLQMLVYRGFAVQDDSRRYLAGPGLGAKVPDTGSHGRLRTLIQPYLELLSERVGETTNLMVRVGTTVRFLSSVEGSGWLRVGDRRGAVLPATATSAGKILLSWLPQDDLARLYRTSSARTVGEYLDEDAFRAFLRSLATIRSVGLAFNREEAERGVSAVACAVRDREGRPLAALSVSVPGQRGAVIEDPAVIRALREVVGEIETEIAGAPTASPA
ncbi:IclR family transcriptional regulator [Kocuria sp. CPCC 205292]|uniref:IclR family transcriptional regulator n=1 Tax=Kocuria cellulosilytica TaxID=3071451 RepID=UPI0034D5EA38